MLKPKPRTPSWKAQEGSQAAVLNRSYIFELLYHGTRGPGKSDVLLMCFARHTGQGYGADWRGIIFRQTYKQLQDLIAKSKKWFPMIWPKVQWHGSDHKWIWPSGEELLLRQFNKDDDYWNYHGHEYPFVGWDELTNWPSMNGYKRMLSCCRSSNPDVPRMIRSTTNPYGPGHNAVKHYFELPHKDGIIRKTPFEFEDAFTGEKRKEWLTRLTIKGTVYENKILLSAQPGYIAQLKKSARNEAELKAWLEGSWDIVAGGMFDDVWIEEQNVVLPFQIPFSWRLDRSFDWGSSKPFSVGWWAQSDGSDYLDANRHWHSTVRGDIYRVAEWYGWNGEPNEGLKMLAVDIAKGIVERERRWWGDRPVVPGPADTSIFTMENGMSIGSDMQKAIRLDDGAVIPGVSWSRADKKPGSRIAGWEKLRTLIRDAHRAEAGAREKPGLYVFDGCAQFRRTVPVLPRDDNKMDDVNTDAEDHVGDESRYRVRAVSAANGGNGRHVGMY